MIAMPSAQNPVNTELQSYHFLSETLRTKRHMPRLGHDYL